MIVLDFTAISYQSTEILMIEINIKKCKLYKPT